MTLRSNTARMVLVALLAAGAAVGLMLLLFPQTATTAAGTVSPIVRLAAQYDMFNGNEFWTEEEPSDDATGGTAIFNTAVTAPASANVLYVTVSGTGDVHEGSTLMLACLVNNVPCRGGEGNANDRTGWVTLQNTGENDWHDNNINYTWCRAITPGTTPRHVQIRMASSDGGTVYMETTHFFVDASTLAPHGCDQANTPDGFEEEGPSKASHTG